MSKSIHIFLKVIIITVCALTISFFLFLGLILALNKTYKLNTYAQTFLNNHLVGKMKFDSIHFIFKDFPNISVSAKNGYLISGVSLYPNDTLCSFNKLIATINPFKIFSTHTIDIPYIYLNSPNVLVSLNSEGQTDWDIWRFKKEKNYPHVVVPDRKKIKLNIGYVEIYNSPKFHYHNLHTGLRINATAQEIIQKGRIAINYRKLDTDFLFIKNLTFAIRNSNDNFSFSTNCDTIKVYKILNGNFSNYFIDVPTKNDFFSIKGTNILENNNIHILGNLGVGYGYRLFSFQNFALKKENDTFILKGLMRKIHQIKGLETDVKYLMTSQNLDELISDIPPLQKLIPSSIEYQLPLKIDGKANGILSIEKKTFPNLEMVIESSNATMKYSKLPIFFFPYANVKLKHVFDNNKTNVNLNNFVVKILNSRLQLKGTWNDIREDSNFNVHINSDLQLRDLKDFLPQYPLTRGILKGDTDLNTSLLSLKKHDWEQINTSGTIGLKNFYYEDFNSSKSLSSTIDSINLFFHNPFSNNKSADNFPQLLIEGVKGRIALDRQTNSYFDNFKLKIKNVRNELFNTELHLQNIYYSKPNTRVHIGKLSSRLDIPISRPWILTDSACVQGLLHNFYYEQDSSIIISRNIGVYLDLNKIENNERDSLKKIDNKALYKIINEVNLIKGSILPLKDFFNQYNFLGGLYLDTSYLRTPILPLYNRVENIRLAFSNQNIKIPSMKFTTGNSHLSLNGNIDGWSDYLFDRKSLGVDLRLRSDTLDIIELVRAFTKGIYYINHRKGPSVDSLAERLLPPDYIPPKNIDKRTTEEILQLPENINLKVSLSATPLIYDSLKLQRLEGEILLTNKSLFLKNYISDPYLGLIDINASYRPINSVSSKSQMNVKMKKVPIPYLIKLVPDFQRVIPMITSLEGAVGCEMSASALFDSTMYLVVPSINGAATVKGTNLAIEKKKVLPSFIGWLLLGNKKHVEIDSISVDLLMKNGILNIYPFEADIGNLRFLASGFQGTEDTFFYHLVLLKWFLPFRLAMNVYKENDKMNFSLARPKLKSLKLPARILNVNPNQIYPLTNIETSIKQRIQKQQSTYVTFSDYYHAFIEKENLEMSQKQTVKILNEIKDLRKKAEEGD